jgi:GNAT superfamily N-acetyltransferase
MTDIEISRGYAPGAIGRVVEMHGDYYARRWGFGIFFEAKAAKMLAEFLSRYDEKRDGFWTASRAGRVEGSIAIDGLRADTAGAHLRWFIVSEDLHGRGVGSALLSNAVDFCRSSGYRKVYLWTFEGLLSARRLYEKTGFRLVEQCPGTQWGKEVHEQRFELQLP